MRMKLKFKFVTLIIWMMILKMNMVLSWVARVQFMKVKQLELHHLGVTMRNPRRKLTEQLITKFHKINDHVASLKLLNVVTNQAYVKLSINKYVSFI